MKTTKNYTPVMMALVASLFLAGLLWSSLVHDDRTVLVDRRINSLAKERGDKIIEVEKLENKFVDRVGLGGGGGLGSPYAVVGDVDTFFSLLPKPATILTHTGADTRNVESVYWGYSTEIILVEKVETVTAPYWDTLELNPDKNSVIFKSNIFLILLIISLGMIMLFTVCYIILQTTFDMMESKKVT